ncbi:MAG: efflux RND transporter periplasmic adaptor subunit [Leptolyngbyaceae cyanobacterium SM1_1_3]|nr:efflux RND transporter periplasmic adaptor subunit [Leptolyngbyaceae cyanobacterium SM1_1_3]NJN04996.1 efflux RND transporter periplasmic adaptor subunit [Leptolyngbyaceae cyanobacterium RM1_1_2]NJO11515.1 efflux RND transporter periplasmic adaptor subunit [Leptolyngbyaceae cyanobacterium SL_1_1]
MQLPLIGKVKRPAAWIVGLLAVGILTTGAIAFGILRSRVPPYELADYTTTVEATALTVQITASGTVKPVKTVNLSPKNAGILAEIYVEQGDRVAAGDLIGRMEANDLEAQLRQNQASLAEAEAQLTDLRQGSDAEQIAQARAGVETAQAQLRDAQARRDLASDRLSRNQQLYAQGAISANELDSLNSEARIAQAAIDQARSQINDAQQRLQDLRNNPDADEIAQAEARVAQAQAQVDAGRIRVEDTLIRAPFAGIITQKFATEGAFVTPTTSASSATSATSTAIVAVASDLEVVAEVPEADIGKIRPGQSVEIRADAVPDETFRGEVRLIAPEAVEQQNVTLFEVRIQLLEGQERLRSNMNADVAFIGDAVADALVVPTVAVVTQEGQPGVLIPGDRNRIRFRPVTLGSQVGDQIQILDGIQAGDRVFIDLPPGQTLENLTFGQQEKTEQ